MCKCHWKIGRIECRFWLSYSEPQPPTLLSVQLSLRVAVDRGVLTRYQLSTSNHDYRVPALCRESFSRRFPYRYISYCNVAALNIVVMLLLHSNRIVDQFGNGTLGLGQSRAMLLWDETFFIFIFPPKAIKCSLLVTFVKKTCNLMISQDHHQSFP